MSIYEEDWDFERQQYVSSRKVGKPLGYGFPHYPNKAERALLIQLMKKSGKTEEQVREDKSNRRKLAQASKSMSSSTMESRKSRRDYKLKIARRRQAARLGVEVWQLK